MIGNDWDEVLKNVFEGEGFKKFMKIIDHKYLTETVFPPRNYLFNALKLTPYKDVKVVIVGQDPYHGEGEAHGLSFSVKEGVKMPPSLRNGVLLLNSILTVKKDEALSHQDLGWERLTDYIIKILNKKNESIVFILWGNFARSKKKLITNPKHLIIESAHPSPLSAYHGFFGSHPFSKTNNFLRENGREPVDFS